MGAQLWNIEKVVKKGDYLYAVVKGHPRATRHGYVLLHRIVMENHLGKLLEGSEVVHHKDGNRKNNSIDNLELMSLSKHSSDHIRSKGKIMVLMKCPTCGEFFERRIGISSVTKGRGVLTACSRRCRGIFWRKFQIEQKTQLVERAISENIVRIFRRFPDNSEETLPRDSVETIRMQPETAKI